MCLCVCVCREGGGEGELIDKQGDFAFTNSLSCCIALKFQNVNHSQGDLCP